MSNFFFANELGTADEGEYGGRWNQLLCYKEVAIMWKNKESYVD